MKRKRSLQYVHFRRGRVHFNSILKKIAVTYKLKSLLLKQGRERDEIFEVTWEVRENG